MERFYHDSPVSVNHKDTMADLVELDMVDFDFIVVIDWLHACYGSIIVELELSSFKLLMSKS